MTRRSRQSPGTVLISIYFLSHLIVIYRIAACWLSIQFLPLPPLEYSQHSSQRDFFPQTPLRLCHSFAQNPPGSPQVTQYELKVLSPAWSLLIWPCLQLSSHPLQPCWPPTAPRRLDRLLARGLYMYSCLWLEPPDYVLVRHCKSFPKCHFLRRPFLSHCSWDFTHRCDLHFLYCWFFPLQNWTPAT